MEEFVKDEVVRITGKFRVDGVLTNPDTVTLYVLAPDNNEYEITVASSVVGIWYGNVDHSASGVGTVDGVWSWRWVATGAAQGAEEGKYRLLPSQFPGIPGAVTPVTLASWAVKRTDGGLEAITALGNLGATETLDISDANLLTGTLDENCVITMPSGLTSGVFIRFSLKLTNAGAFTATFTGVLDAQGDALGVQTPNSVEWMTFSTTDGGATWYGFISEPTGGGGFSPGYGDVDWRDARSEADTGTWGDQIISTMPYGGCTQSGATGGKVTYGGTDELWLAAGTYNMRFWYYGGAAYDTEMLAKLDDVLIATIDETVEDPLGASANTLVAGITVATSDFHTFSVENTNSAYVNFSHAIFQRTGA